MKFEQYLREKNILYEFLKEYSDGKLGFNVVPSDKMISTVTCSSIQKCSECCLVENCTFSQIGDSSINANTYVEHFNSLLEEYKKTNPEEFI